MPPYSPVNATVSARQSITVPQASKWLARIELRSEPWPGHFQHVVYLPVAEPGVVAGGHGSS
jgi:hypothetical protein